MFFIVTAVRTWNPTGFSKQLIKANAGWSIRKVSTTYLIAWIDFRNQNKGFLASFRLRNLLPTELSIKECETNWKRGFPGNDQMKHAADGTSLIPDAPIDRHNIKAWQVLAHPFV
jgi:hypothetical protein